MSQTIVITQSNYIPWRGYFDLVRRADVLIVLDSVQYTRRDWRNRNRIKTERGPRWLTIAVQSKGAFDQSIDAARVADAGWAESHIRSIDLNYRRAPAFKDTAPWLFDQILEASRRTLLSEVNLYLIEAICGRLGIRVPTRLDREIIPPGELAQLDATDRLIQLAKSVGASNYLSGPAAKGYLDTARFAQHGIGVEWMSYEGYRDYPQCWGPFDPGMSIVDLLLNCGAEASSYLQGGSVG